MKDKLLIFDLDGTLFDTKKVNYMSYQKAITDAGFQEIVDYDFYCSFCNGNNYKVFLPMIIKNINEASLKKIHDLKKQYYSENLKYARINTELIELIKLSKEDKYIALVTSASLKNTKEILEYFNVEDLFDSIITQEDVKKQKPDPECFLLAMKKFKINAQNTLIYEDSETGLEAAAGSGAEYIKVTGYN